jgi:hypothetical protein
MTQVADESEFVAVNSRKIEKRTLSRDKPDMLKKRNFPK